MTNIFKNAYFGKAYKTRAGKKAILIQPKTYHVMLEDLTEYSVMKDGLAYDDMATSYDIVSEWQEEIKEEELDELAETYFLNTYNNGFKDPNLEIINEKEFAVADFKAGYRTALNQ